MHFDHIPVFILVAFLGLVLRVVLRRRNRTPDRSYTSLLLGDWPPKDDVLGFSTYVNLLINRVRRYSEECKTRPIRPSLRQIITAFLTGEKFRREKSAFTVGIYGKWGCGKTTFLKLFRDRLEKDHKIDTVWLDAWRYNKEDELWAALLQNILTNAPTTRNVLMRPYIKLRIWLHTIDWKGSTWELVRHMIYPLLRGTIAAILILIALDINTVITFVNRIIPITASIDLPLYAKALLGISGILVLGPTDVVKAFDTQLNIDLENFRKNTQHRSKTGFLTEFKENFQWLIDLVYPRSPLVVIIDDLDRCLPEVAVEILEAIKLFLDVDRCVFVLGINKELIADAIHVRYRELLENKTSLSDNQSNPVGRAVIGFGNTYLDRIVQHAFTIPPMDEVTKCHFIESLLPKEHNTDEVVEVLVQGLEANPRKIKQAVHLYLMWMDLHEKLDEINKETVQK